MYMGGSTQQRCMHGSLHNATCPTTTPSTRRYQGVTSALRMLAACAPALAPLAMAHVADLLVPLTDLRCSHTNGPVRQCADDALRAFYDAVRGWLGAALLDAWRSVVLDWLCQRELVRMMLMPHDA